MNRIVILIIVLLAGLYFVNGTGRMFLPPGRSTLWRFFGGYGYDLEVNYDDGNLNCGGVRTNGDLTTSCGVCGDPFNAVRKENSFINSANPTDRGLYVTGIPGYLFEQGMAVDFVVQIESGSRGWFKFQICNLPNADTEVTEGCFQDLTISPSNTGTVLSGNRYQLPDQSAGSSGMGHNVTVQLPASLTCNHCVVRWIWLIGTDYGCGPTGCCVGCGKQQTIVNCADVIIASANNFQAVNSTFNWPRYDDPYASVHGGHNVTGSSISLTTLPLVHHTTTTQTTTSQTTTTPTTTTPTTTTPTTTSQTTSFTTKQTTSNLIPIVSILTTTTSSSTSSSVSTTATTTSTDNPTTNKINSGTTASTLFPIITVSQGGTTQSVEPVTISTPVLIDPGPANIIVPAVAAAAVASSSNNNNNNGAALLFILLAMFANQKQSSYQPRYVFTPSYWRPLPIYVQRFTYEDPLIPGMQQGRPGNMNNGGYGLPKSRPGLTSYGSSGNSYRSQGQQGYSSYGQNGYNPYKHQIIRDKSNGYQQSSFPVQQNGIANQNNALPQPSYDSEPPVIKEPENATVAYSPDCERSKQVCSPRIQYVMFEFVCKYDCKGGKDDCPASICRCQCPY